MTVGDDEFFRLRCRINQKQMRASRMAHILPTMGPTIHALKLGAGTEPIIPDVSFGLCFEDAGLHVRTGSEAGVVSFVGSAREGLADEVTMTGTLLASSLNSVQVTVTMTIDFDVRTPPAISMSEMIVRVRVVN